MLAQSSVDGAMTLPTKRIDGAKCQVFAIVFPDHVTDAVANAPLTIGTLGFHSSPMAPRPEVTARGVMRDGSRVTIPVAYRRTAPPQPELSGTQPTLTVAPNPQRSRSRHTLSRPGMVAGRGDRLRPTRTKGAGGIHRDRRRVESMPSIGTGRAIRVPLCQPECIS